MLSIYCHIGIYKIYPKLISESNIYYSIVSVGMNLGLAYLGHCPVIFHKEVNKALDGAEVSSLHTHSSLDHVSRE